MAGTAEQRVLGELAVEVAGGAFLFEGDRVRRVCLSRRRRAGRESAGADHEGYDSPVMPLSV